MNTNEIVASLNESQIRRACAALLPTKFLDEYFTPERGNIALLRQILEDHVFEHDTPAAEIIEAAGAGETANETKAPEFSELSHAGQRLDIYLHNDSFIYEYYTQKAIEAIVNDGLSISSEDVRKYVKGAIYRASWQVEKYDHMTPTAQDIEQVTRNYVAYIVDCAK